MFSVFGELFFFFRKKCVISSWKQAWKCGFGMQNDKQTNNAFNNHKNFIYSFCQPFNLSSFITWCQSNIKIFDIFIFLWLFNFDQCENGPLTVVTCAMFTLTSSCRWCLGFITFLQFVIRSIVQRFKGNKNFPSIISIDEITCDW